MLSQDSLNAAAPLTTILDNNDLIITPLANTPLEALVKATRSDPLFNIATQVMDPASGISKTEYIPDIVNIGYIANVRDPVLNTNSHDLAMDDIIEVASKAVLEHIVFAKSVVAPAIVNLVMRTKEKLNTITPSTLLGMEVIVWNPPKPLLNSGLESSVRKFEDLALDYPMMNIKSPDVTISTISDLMKSGSGALDKDIDEWMAIKGDSFFFNIWENVFQIKPKFGNNVNDTFKYWIYESDDAVDNALAIYLLSRKLLDNPLPETENNLIAFNKTILDYRNQSAARLSLAYAELDNIDKSKILVRSMTKNTTTVNGGVYDTWIKNGGENEVLFGNILQLPSSVSVADIDKKAIELKTLWNKHATLISSIERNHVFSRTKEILSYEFQEQLFEVSDSSTTLENRERITKLFEDCLDDLREDELVDLYDACLKLLSASRFANTEARRILLGIDRISKENPNIDVRECAAISVLEYVSYWIASQFKVTKI